MPGVDNNCELKKYSAPYLCTLSPEALDYAIDNLHEDPGTREEEIRCMQRWIDSKPYLNAHKDDLTVLQFLRGCKFDQERARRKILHYYEMRTTAPEWFNNRDPYLPQLQQLLKLGVFLPLLKRDPATGYIVIIIRAAVHSPKKFSMNDVFKVSKMVMELTARTEELVSVYGVQAIIDLAGVGLGHALQLTPSLIKKVVHAWQDCYPIRTRSMDFVNCPTHINVVLNIFRRFMSEKMRNRVRVHGCGSKVMSSITSPDILPVEYGGTSGSLSDLIDYWHDATRSCREWFLSDEVRRADLDKKDLQV